MISVQEALEIILQHTQHFGVEEVSFREATGRILKEQITADRDFPPFNRVAMDGIAIDFSSFEKGIHHFKIEGIQAAGAVQKKLKNPEHCIEVMTGAVLPKGTDTVVPYEMIEIDGKEARITIDEIKKDQNIHHQGKDQQKGGLLIPENTLLGPAEIGVIATVGKAQVQVAKPPKVLIISTGDELVEVSDTPKPHQIRRSNSFSLQSLLQPLSIDAQTVHLKDDKDSLTKKIKGFLKSYDVLLFSGAVSKGKFDYLPEVLANLGVEKQFHSVAQRPGKPFWFGTITHENANPQNHTTTVFAFPGNPISTYVNCLVYFYPWYQQSQGIAQRLETVILGEDVTFSPHLTYFLQARIEIKYGHLVAYPIVGNGSGDLASLAKADGFVQLPADKTVFKKGETYTFIRYR